MVTPYRAALDEEWDKLKNVYDDVEAFAFKSLQTAAYDTPFHLAVFSQSEEPLQSFLDKAKADPKAKSTYLAKNIYGNTALHEAAANGNIEAVQILMKHDKEFREDRNKEGEMPLPEETNNEGETPLFKAAAYGQTEVVSYLAEESCTNGQLKKIHRMKKKPVTSILHAAIEGENFETAFELLNLDKSLATAVDGNGMTSLELLATMPSAFRSAYRMSIWKSLLYFCPLIDAKRRIWLPTLRRILNDKRKHKFAFELTTFLIERDTLWQQIVEKSLSACFEGLGDIQGPLASDGEGSKPTSKSIALFLATERGIKEIVNEILKQTPQLAEYIDDKNQNMLHIAIMHRQKEIFDIVKEMNIPMKRLVRGIDEHGYTILHHAADKINDNADIHRGPAYHLQEELKWYKRVEKLAPTHFAMFPVTPKDHEAKEKKKYNCKELFKLKHDNLLKEAQQWVKETSQSCSAVAVLVATVVFAAAYTVPGGSNEKGYPVFLNNNFFLVFTVMDVVALACSLTSVVMFLSVLTSPFSYEEFHHRLPRKLTIGFSLLFVALTTTMLAFAATLLLIVRYQKPHWTTTLIYTAAFFPVSIFALTQFPMHVAFKVAFLEFFRRIKKVHKWINKAHFRKRFKKLLKKKVRKNDESSKKIDDHEALPPV